MPRRPSGGRAGGWAAKAPRWTLHRGWQLPFKGPASPPPASWKLSKEKLFCCQDDPGERHAGATLVYLGTESKFCLVHCVSLDDYGKRRHLLRLTTFSLELDGNGDLRITSRRLVRSFRLPKAVLESRSEFFTKPVALWM
ncbi:hypothetical protein BRADI_1g08525v3 [Brachypodium distachyon]|uniref:Uncharacterized protein n=1 Tax=Brachypodium distachyon TaxID=15368 RepID=A0A0Q3RJ72_BRADI|nr:hypothetical protein BRADI_1g08525v3 [Brachypodium distachyon]